MAAIPPWLTGRGVTAYVITGAVAGGTGTITDGTTTGIQPLAGIWEEFDLTSEPSTEEISASDTARQHTVILQEATRVRMSVIMEKALRSSGGANDKANPLAWIATNYDLFKIVLTRGANTWTGYFTRGAYSEAIRKGKCIQTLAGEPLDPGAVNPAYS